MPPGAAIKMIDPTAGVVRLVIAGDLDGTDETVLAAYLGAASREDTRTVIVDMTEVTHVSARALRQLVLGRRRLGEQHRRLLVIAGEGPVHRALELAGPGALELYDSEREALEAAAAGD